MGLRAVLGAVLVLGWGLALPAGSETLLILDSDAGDYVGQGALRQFVPADGSFSAFRNADQGVSVGFTGGESWDLDFAAPGDVDLQNLLYEDATRYPFQAPAVPGLSVSGDGRGCSELTGSFQVHEIVYGTGTDVDSFAADFVQFCDGSPRKLVGSIRFNSADVLPDLFDDDMDGVGEIGDNCPGLANPDQRDSDQDFEGDVCDADPRATFVLFASEAGDYVGQGLRQHFNVANALIGVEEGSGGGLDVDLETGDFWHLSLAGPAGSPPTVGVYEGATRFGGPAQPTLDVGGDGRGCNSVAGRFEVFEAEFAPDGTPLVFSADFEQHCEGADPALFGSIRYRAAFRPVKKDLDGDGWLDAEDNCRGVPNPPQYDTDADGVGDGCGLSASKQKCVNEMNKAGAALLKLRGAANLACLKNAAKGKLDKLGVPATAQDCLTNDVGGKSAKAVAKIAAKQALLCADVPEFGYAGAGAVAATADALSPRVMEALFGSDLDAVLIPAATDPVGAKCQEELAKRTHASIDALWKLTLKQKKAVLLGAKVLSATSAESLGDKLAAHLDSDPGGAVTRSFAALGAGAVRRCSAVANLGAAFPGVGGACPVTDVASLSACAERYARCFWCLELGGFDGPLPLDCDVFDNGVDDLTCG
jgi:hypothetical protein